MTVGDRNVIAFYDERMLGHAPDTSEPFLPGRMERKVREMLAGLGIKWSYPEESSRLTAIMDLLQREPVPGVHFETGAAATREQLGHVHTTSYLKSIFELRGKNAWRVIGILRRCPSR